MRLTGGFTRVTAVLIVGLVVSGSPGVAQTPIPGTAIDRVWNPPILVSSDRAHRETSIALSPTDPNKMFICDPSGVPNTTYNQSYFHLSSDGGQTWAYEDVEGGATDPRNYFFEGGDCDVAFDAGGTMYSADTWLGSLSVGHSTDGGATWDGTSIAASAPVVDRPWLVGGPAGTIYVSYQDLQCCMVSAIWFTKSTDGGKTFLPAVPVATANNGGAFTWEGNYAVSPNGNDIYLVYTRRQGPAVLTGLDEQGPETVWVAASHDGGLTWTSNQVAAMPNPASFLYPSIAMDKDGGLHVVFASRRTAEGDRPIWYATSTDQAVTWTPAQPLSEGAAGYSPWITTDANGDALVIWYGSPDPAATDQVPVEWFFYWARVAGGTTTTRTITSGTTTEEPIYTGRSGIPEFEQLRVDADGMVHIGMSAYRGGPSDGAWAIYYQREILAPVVP